MTFLKNTLIYSVLLAQSLVWARTLDVSDKISYFGVLKNSTDTIIGPCSIHHFNLNDKESQSQIMGIYAISDLSESYFLYNEVNGETKGFNHSLAVEALSDYNPDFFVKKYAFSAYTRDEIRPDQSLEITSYENETNLVHRDLNGDIESQLLIGHDYLVRDYSFIKEEKKYTCELTPQNELLNIQKLTQSSECLTLAKSLSRDYYQLEGLKEGHIKLEDFTNIFVAYEILKISDPNSECF